ncbi:hypothetical protein TUSST3_40440 [Streptomyces sp. TUS-ST3]|nr:hypothetical protein TUSST3_40440 [Streptomyces sp. TUS-ST3]
MRHTLARHALDGALIRDALLELVMRLGTSVERPARQCGPRPQGAHTMNGPVSWGGGGQDPQSGHGLSTGTTGRTRPTHAKVRALVEQAIATLKSWRILRKLRCSTTRITNLVQAVLTLHLASSD